MSLAIVFEDDSVAYLDAITNYSKTRSSSISEHAVDKSALITDHVSKNNEVFSFRAVVSSADFQTTYTRPAGLLEGTESNPPLSPEANTPVRGALISNPSTLLDYLPGSIGQLLGNSITSDVALGPFRGYIHEVVRDRFNRAWENSEVVSIVDIDFDISTGRISSSRVYEDCIIERFDDVEQVDTGDALEANFTVRKVRFATIKEVDVQINQSPSSSEVSDQASSAENKGDQTGAETTGDIPETENPRLIEQRAGRINEIFDSLTGRQQETVINEVTVE